MPVHVLQFWRIEIYVGNLHVCLLRRLKPSRAGAGMFQILRELELEPVSLKIKSAGGFKS